jgi:hypothetical protein
VELITGHPETKTSHSRSACVVTSRLWEETERGYGAGVLFFWLADQGERSLKRAILSLSRSKIGCCKDKKLHQSMGLYFNQNSDVNAREIR